MTISNAELFDVGLGFSNAWRPQIATVTSPLSPDSSLMVTGAGFRGISGASGGNGSQDSASDHPVAQLRAVESERTVFLLITNWQTNAFASAPVSGLPPGWTLATVFVNGIPSDASLLNLSIPVLTPPVLTNVQELANGAFHFTFTNSPGALFAALATTNLALPLSNWTVLGQVPEISPGQFAFTDTNAPPFSMRFYRAGSP
jgi:hypothetical protein